MNEVSMGYSYPRTIRKQDIDEILYNTYATNGWNPDYEQIPVQRRLKFINGVVRKVIQNPELAEKDPTYAKIFENCMKSVRKQCGRIPSDKVELFGKKYTTEILKLDEKYTPRVMAALFDMGQLKESFDTELKSAQNSIRAMEINYSNSLRAEQAAFTQCTIRPNARISQALKQTAGADAYGKAG